MEVRLIDNYPKNIPDSVYIRRLEETEQVIDLSFNPAVLSFIKMYSERKRDQVERMIAVSSVGADRASKTFYLRVKGEVGRDLAKGGFKRLDILRPGLLKGQRSSDRRLGERAAIIASPVADLLLHGKFRQYRSIPAQVVAEGILALALKTTQGRFVHDNDAIRRAARGLPRPLPG